MVRTALVTLSVAVALAAVGAVVHGVQSLPDERATAAVAAPTTATATADAPEAPRAHGTVHTAGEVASTEGQPAAFTVGQLHDGEVTVARFTAFWDAEVQRIRTAPCPGPTAPGSTVVVMSVGATPPAHLGEDYPDYAPLLSDARAAAADTCA